MYFVIADNGSSYTTDLWENILFDSFKFLFKRNFNGLVLKGTWQRDILLGGGASPLSLMRGIYFGLEDDRNCYYESVHRLMSLESMLLWLFKAGKNSKGVAVWWYRESMCCIFEFINTKSIHLSGDLWSAD